MADFLSVVPASTERTPPPSFSLSITDELNRILAMLHQAFPDAAQIGFDFDRRLQVHIDVRKREQVTLVQAVLPSLGGGLFHDVSIRATPNHPFLHRISALVEA